LNDALPIFLRLELVDTRRERIALLRRALPRCVSPPAIQVVQCWRSGRHRWEGTKLTWPGAGRGGRAGPARTGPRRPAARCPGPRDHQNATTVAPESRRGQRLDQRARPTDVT